MADVDLAHRIASILTNAVRVARETRAAYGVQPAPASIAARELEGSSAYESAWSKALVFDAYAMA